MSRSTTAAVPIHVLLSFVRFAERRNEAVKNIELFYQSYGINQKFWIAQKA